jgi:hypothetical protein
MAQKLMARTPFLPIRIHGAERIHMHRMVITICAVVSLSSLQANAHSWYPIACCSNQDCQPVDHSEILSTPAGWKVAPTGEVIPYGDSREHFSPDGQFHRCSRHFVDPSNKDSTICLFVPGMAS